MKRIGSFLLMLILIVTMVPAAGATEGAAAPVETTETPAMPADQPEIETQPKSVTVAEGRTATFQVKAKKAAAYQWQYRESVLDNWADYKGGTSDTLEIKVTSKHDGYRYRCVLTGSEGTQVTTSAATLTAEPLVFGFNYTAAELEKKITQLVKTASSKWTGSKKTVPQTLDKFPLVPSQFNSLFSKVKNAKSSLTNKGTVWTWTTNVDSIFDGIRFSYGEPSAYADLRYEYKKGKEEDRGYVGLIKSKAGVYQVDLSKAELAEGQTAKSITIEQEPRWSSYVSYSSRLWGEYGAYFYPKAKPSYRRFRLDISVDIADRTSYNISWYRYTYDNILRIDIDRYTPEGSKTKHVYWWLQYDLKTKKLTNYGKSVNTY